MHCIMNKYPANVYFERLVFNIRWRKVYIYGAGAIGKNFERALRYRGINIEGFIVTRKSTTPNSIAKHYIYEYDEIKEWEKDNSVILIACNNENTIEISKKLSNQNIEYYAIPEEWQGYYNSIVFP